MDIQTWIEQLAVRQNALAKERDRLDDVISEMEGLRETCETAMINLQDARDALSELV